MNQSNVLVLPDALRTQVRSVLDSDAHVTQTRIAREVGVSATVISQWLSGGYPGDNSAVEAKVGRWLAKYQERASAGASTMPATPAFVPTPTALRVQQALHYAQMAGDVTAIYGASGIGKTAAIRAYIGMSLNCWVATMSPATSGVVTALEEICAALGIQAAGGAARTHRDIVRRVTETGGLLIIDEAQHLSPSALDQIRAIHDHAHIGLALVGNDYVYSRMDGAGKRADHLDRLRSRVGKRVKLSLSSAADIDALLKAWGIPEDASWRSALVAFGRRPGALRGLTKVLRLASSYAALAGRPLEQADVDQARTELGGEA